MSIKSKRTIRRFFSKLRQDLFERFVKFETVQGLYLLPAGLAGLVITWTNLQYILQAMGTTYFGYLVLCGAWKIFYNPVKQKLRRNQLVRNREFEAGVK